MVLDQYTIYNNTDIILYLNSKEIEMKPGEKRWFYFDVFDARYVLSAVGFLIIGHKYGKIFIEGDGQLDFTIDQGNGAVFVTMKNIECNCSGSGKTKNCKTCKWYNKKVPNMAYCAKPTDEIINEEFVPNPKQYSCDNFEGRN